MGMNYDRRAFLSVATDTFTLLNAKLNDNSKFSDVLSASNR
jgi:hypothetical protein